MYRKFVEAGRVAYVNFGACAGKPVIIADIADSHRVLIVNPFGGYKRVLFPLKRLSLTNLRVKILRGARNSTIKKAVEEYKLKEKWEKSSIN